MVCARLATPVLRSGQAWAQSRTVAGYRTAPRHPALGGLLDGTLRFGWGGRCGRSVGPPSMAVAIWTVVRKSRTCLAIGGEMAQPSMRRRAASGWSSNSSRGVRELAFESGLHRFGAFLRSWSGRSQTWPPMAMVTRIWPDLLTTWTTAGLKEWLTGQ